MGGLQEKGDFGEGSLACIKCLLQGVVERGLLTATLHAMALRKDGLGRRRKENSSTPLRAHQSARGEKGRLEPNSKRLSQTLSDESSSPAVR